jgi:hypothetical protein
VLVLVLVLGALVLVLVLGALVLVLVLVLVLGALAQLVRIFLLLRRFVFRSMADLLVCGQPRWPGLQS